MQTQQGLAADGIAGPATLKKLGISVGAIPSATGGGILRQGGRGAARPKGKEQQDCRQKAEERQQGHTEPQGAEARGEPYSGQVAVGAVVLNRVEHPSFPDTISGVIYQEGAFTAIVDGQFDQPIADSAYKAARDALAGQDPSGGAVYYFKS